MIGGTPIVEKIYVEDKPVTLVGTTSLLAKFACVCLISDCARQTLVLRLADEFDNLLANDKRLQDLVIQPVLTDAASNRLSLRTVQFTPEGRAPFNETLTLVPGPYHMDFMCLLSASLIPADSIAPLACTFAAVDGAL